MKRNFFRCFIKSLVIGCMITSGLQALADDGHGQWVKFTDIHEDDGQLYLDSWSVITPANQPNWRHVRIIFQKDLKLDEFRRRGSETAEFTIDCENVSIRKGDHKVYKNSWAKGQVLELNKGDEAFIALDTKLNSTEEKVMTDLYKRVCKK